MHILKKILDFIITVGLSISVKVVKTILCRTDDPTVPSRIANSRFEPPVTIILFTIYLCPGHCEKLFVRGYDRGYDQSVCTHYETLNER